MHAYDIVKSVRPTDDVAGDLPASDGWGETALSVAIAAAQASTLEELADGALAALVAAGPWQYGALWIPAEGADAVRCAGDWSGGEDALRHATLDATFGPKRGAVGRAWASGALVVADVGGDADDPRREAVLDAGLRFAAAVPVTHGGAVLGVLDVLTATRGPLSDSARRPLEAAGRVVGAAVARIQRERGEGAGVEALRAEVEAIAAVMDAAAAGDLTVRPGEGRDAAVARIGAGFEKLLTQLGSSLSRITASAEVLATSSEEMAIVSDELSSNANDASSLANSVSSAANEISQNANTVAAGMQQMDASIREIAKNSAAAAKVASSAVKMAETSTASITKLAKSSSEIGKVVGVISSVAQQTNLLALNAAIEAARAGAAGKGFAVVANEVKDLARATARATDDINARVEAIQSDTRSAAATIAEITTIVGQIADFQTMIACAVEEQTATTAEVARHVLDVATGSQQIADSSGRAFHAAQSTASGAVSTQGAANQLSRMASELQSLVSKFRV